MKEMNMKRVSRENTIAKKVDRKNVNARMMSAKNFIASFFALICLSFSALAMHPTPEKKYTVGVVLYDNFETIDVFGPVQMWGYIPEFDIVMISEFGGPVRSAQGTSVVSDHSFKDAPKVDILLVPGGVGTFAQVNNPNMIDYIQQVNETSLYTTSVCTGSVLLAKAGILDGIKATTNKRFFFMSERFTDNTEWVEKARWVESGKIFTSSGVTAGTDMALGLIDKMYGEMWSTGIASSLEYTWDRDSDNDPFSEYTNRLVEGFDGLVSAMPMVNGKLSTPPQWIWLFFDSLPDVATGTIELKEIDGEVSENLPLVNLHTMGNDDLMIGIQDPLSSGQYEISWKANLQNGKQSQETYRFSVE